MAADDFPQHPATPKDSLRAHPAGGSNAPQGSSKTPRRVVGVYDRPERTSRVMSPATIGIIVIFAVLVLLWISGIFSL
jgi:hypothetical protein